MLVGALALFACGGGDDDDAVEPPAATTGAAGVAATPAPSAAPSGQSDDAGFTADQLCTAIDPADVEAAVGPVKELQQIDATYCNVILDLPGMGNMLNVSIQPPVLPDQDPGALFEATVEGRRLMAGEDAEATPVEGIGDRAAAIPGNAGEAIVVLIGSTVASFDPHLAEGAVTVAQWQAMLGPALADL